MNFRLTNFVEISELGLCRDLDHATGCPVLACTGRCPAAGTSLELSISEYGVEEYAGNWQKCLPISHAYSYIRLRISGAAQQFSWVSRKRK